MLEKICTQTKIPTITGHEVLGAQLKLSGENELLYCFLHF